MLPCIPRRLVIANHHVDYRKQWNGLLAECYRMGCDPYLSDCVIFIKRDRTQLRALLGDKLGLLLVARRFEAGKLPMPWLFDADAAPRDVTVAELTLLLDGYAIDRQVRPWQPMEP